MTTITNRTNTMKHLILAVLARLADRSDRRAGSGRHDPIRLQWRADFRANYTKAKAGDLHAASVCEGMVWMLGPTRPLDYTGVVGRNLMGR
jgi:hypothetical protein